ncbi:DUF2125 domain-containing protein [Pseudoruegeria sp. SHC-113]|uniref:DUF2125 domain-containing protein n=1 Tax=Pseudoruegeria sp. SHC-113 TaxID=2855439 RepID=UPI0021BB95EB|nr:DUF2125 domain-containing protein [Pseudoruegeria sp. SHC-113]MCT8158487.1 DUF2125 domain-containing protein [Pseudoruegeria sp. SHC-113]
MTRHMSRMMFTSAAVGAISVFSASAALADLTADDVWQQWRGYMERAGYEVTTGSTDANGGTLTVQELMLSMDVEGMSVALTMPEITFRENGDGTVDIGFPASFPLNMQMEEDGEEVVMAMTFTHENLGMTASGDPENTTYDMAADAFGFSLDSVQAEGETYEDVASATMQGVAGQYALTAGEVMGYLSDLTADSLGYMVDFEEADGAIKLDGTLTQLTSKSSGAMPSEGDPEDMASFLAAGFSADATMGFASSTYALEGSGEGETFAMQGQSGAGDVDVTFSESGIGYGGALRDLSVAVSGSEIPLPSIDVSMGEYGFNLLMPVSKSDAPEAFAAAIRLVDFSVSDMIWGLFDPAGVLPRDPATVELDLSGKANWSVDIFDPEAEAAMTGDLPGELHELILNALQVKLAGADLTGTGAFTFDNADRQTFPGMPRPQGEVNLKLVGGNGLLDKLGQMGLLPEEQLMGARMMLGLFARPGDGADTLVSTIAVDENGGLFANGQQLR